MKGKDLMEVHIPFPPFVLCILSFLSLLNSFNPLGEITTTEQKITVWIQNTAHSCQLGEFHLNHTKNQEYIH